MRGLMRGLRILCIALMALTVLLLPYAGFAQSMPGSGPEWNIRMEYRYTKGKESSLEIPNTITRFGQDYRLIDRQPPVLESSMPTTRVYTWHIEGLLTADEKSFFEINEGVLLTPVEVELDRNVDQVISIGGLATNDVDAIPFVRSFEVASPASESGVELKDFQRAAVQFEVEGYDSWGLPNSYKATVIYRSFEAYLSSEFYMATSTYTTTEETGKADQYVVVATYAPENLLYAGGVEGDPFGGFMDRTDSAVTPPIDLAGEGEEFGKTVFITDELTPGSAGTGGSGFKFWALIPIFVAVAFALASFWLLNKEYERRKKFEARRAARRESSLRSKGLVNFD